MGDVAEGDDVSVAEDYRKAVASGISGREDGPFPTLPLVQGSG